MNEVNLSLKGRTALVTGAKRGIGKEIALVFAEAGADVAVCTRTSENHQIEDVADEIQRMGRNSLALLADISNRIDVENMVEKVIREFGFIDVLVNNAGITGDRGEKGILVNTSEENYEKVMNTDLKGYFLCSQAAGRIMIKKRRGVIINISSSGGLRVPHFPGLGIYAIAKAGVNMLTQVLAKELAPFNIRVNDIAPASVKTPMSVTWNNPEAERQVATKIPLGRVGQTKDIASLALYLASDASSFITGEVILADGGMLL